MSRWAGSVHRLVQRVRNKAFTLLWYRWMFHKIGFRTTIQSPLYAYRPDCIEIGNHCFLASGCRIEAYPAAGSSRRTRSMLKLGSHVKIGPNVLISCGQSLEIDDEVLIAGGCYLSDNNHGMAAEGPAYMDQALRTSATYIGKGAWLGQNVCVLEGSVIGERAIIGAGSIVRGIIPPYSIAVGCPARVVKQYNFETGRWEKVNAFAGKAGNTLARESEGHPEAMVGGVQ